MREGVLGEDILDDLLEAVAERLSSFLAVPLQEGLTAAVVVSVGGVCDCGGRALRSHRFLLSDFHHRFLKYICFKIEEQH